MLILNPLQKKIIYSIIIAATIYFVLFFNVDISSYRILQELWNLGHIVLFIAINYIIYLKKINHSKLSVFTEFVIVLFVSCLVGYAIEMIQAYTGRDKSNYDVLLDVVGGGFAFILFSKTLKKSKMPVKSVFMLLVCSFSVFSLYPLYSNVVDAVYQQRDFPYLLTNINSREITRFKKSNAEMAVESKILAGKSTNVLKIKFEPAVYSTISLEAFNEIWIDYNYVVFSIYSNTESPSIMMLRIHDQAHSLSNSSFTDRFNYHIKLVKGWNKIRISLSDIRHAPLNREMNMKKIKGFMLFKTNLKQPETLYFSEIKLEK